MIKEQHIRLRAIRCALDVHRLRLPSALRTYRQWAKGECMLYDEHGRII